MDGDHDLDELYRAPLKDFVRARNALAAERKKAGDADEAKRIKTLTKPSASAWAVNQVYWRERDIFDALIETGDAYRGALSGEGAAAASEADQARKDSVSSALKAAQTIVEADAQNPSPALMARIATTLDAISSYGSANPAPVSGRLEADIDPPGFGAFAGLVPKSRPAPESTPTETPAAAPASGRASDPQAEKDAEKEAAIDKARAEFASFASSVHALEVEVAKLRDELSDKESRLARDTEKLDQMQVRLKRMDS